MDRELPSLPRPRDSSPHQQDQHASSHNTLSKPPPTRPPPPAPSKANTHDSAGEDGTEDTNIHRQDGPPSRTAPDPRQEDFGDFHFEDHVDWHSGQKSQSPSPPPQIHTPPLRTDSRNASPHTLDHRRPRAESLLPSQSQPNLNVYGSRSVSTPLNSRPNSTVFDSDGEGRMETIKDLRRRSSMMVTNILGMSRPQSEDRGSSQDRPWVMVFTTGIPDPAILVYAGLEFLMTGGTIPELWPNDDGGVSDLFIYFYPPASGKGPQIKCKSINIQSSRTLLALAHDNTKGRSRARSFDGRGSLTSEDATRSLAVRDPMSPPYTPRLSTQGPQAASDSSGDSIRSFGSISSGPRQLHLHLPLGTISGPEQLTRRENESLEDAAEREAREQTLIDARNLFAFLEGQVIVYTKNTPTPFRAFLAIARLLKLYGFTEQGGATYGRAIDCAFDFYLLEYKFADVRSSRTKLLEGLILGEAMKSPILFNEAFAHAVGNYKELKGKNSALWGELSERTKRMIETAYMQLHRHRTYVEERLTDFDFPSAFAGIANSTSSAESKVIRFKQWKSNFMSLRKAVLSYLKKQYGSWPPRASSKRNSFMANGLNRLVLKMLYDDLCKLYDYLVDRTNLTTRGMEGGTDESHEGKPTAISALRKLLNEFDKSTTWETPAMPFDVPHLPDLATLDPTYHRKDPKEQHKEYMKRKLEDNERELLMVSQENVRDGLDKFNTPFMDMFKAFEEKEMRGKTVRELEEQRIGHWIFLYVVLQVLPLVISDAPGLNFATDVEYYLSATPPENMPWIEGRGSQMDLYQTAEGTYSRLPAHQVEFGINSIYSRSHCWTAANVWLAGETTDGQSDMLPPEGQLSPLAPPPGFSGGELRPPSRGRSRSSSHGATPRPHSVGGLLAVRDPNSSRNSRRRSAMMGLEKLPRFEGEEWGGGASPALTTSSGGTAPAVKTPPEKEATFDDILAGMDHGGKEAKKSGKGLLKKRK